jgi:hypothetical protein
MNDMSNIIFYNCKEMGHYAAQCPLKHGKRNHHAHATNVEEKKSKDEEYVL